jgi:hypothetical protein
MALLRLAVKESTIGFVGATSLLLLIVAEGEGKLDGCFIFGIRE